MVSASIRPDVSGPSFSNDAARSRALATDFEASLLRAAFAPVAKAMGFYGDVVVGEAMRVALRSSAGDLDVTP